ncbi:MAG TPA: hypothetical protein VFT45_13650 [Longimicrobium sp.]|nr:hypothetical protein [Longimicrobium sp.]
MSIRPFVVIALLASLGACEEAFAPEQSGTSSFVFDYTDLGEEPADAFVAEGEFPGGGIEPQGGNWAFAARRGPQDQRMVVTAARARSDGRFDAMTLELPANAQRGQTLQFREQCDNQSDCAKMWANFGVAAGSARTVCSVVSGQARVAALTARRVAGSFSGTATCTGAYNGQTLIQRGAFDVAVIEPTTE